MTRLLLFLFFLPMFLFSQEKKTVYLDEASEIIQKPTFVLKEQSKVFFSRTYDLDTVIFKKIHFNYFMGKLDEKNRHQLFALLHQRNQIDTIKTMVIHYQDTLRKKSYFPKQNQIAKLKDGSHRHIPSYKSFFKTHRRCARYFEKESQMNVYHFYNYNEGHPEVYKNLEWYQDPIKLLRKLFYSSGYNNDLWRLVVHPNGDFAIRNWVVDQKVWNDIRKHKNWKKHLSAFKKSLNDLP